MNINPLIEASPAIQLHVAAAALAIALSVAILTIRKSTPAHKYVGRTWAAMLAIICISSFWITGMNGTHYSWIHLLSAWTLIGLSLGHPRGKSRQHTRPQIRHDIHHDRCLVRRGFLRLPAGPSDERRAFSDERFWRWDQCPMGTGLRRGPVGAGPRCTGQSPVPRVLATASSIVSQRQYLPLPDRPCLPRSK